MSEEEEDYGPPPDGDDIAELLKERYSLKKGDKLTVEAETDPLARLAVILESGKDRFEIAVEYLRGAGERDVWLVLADALDALFGQFVESGRAYRDLPQGDDVEYDGVFFRVTVVRTIPELTAQANKILGEDN